MWQWYDDFRSTCCCSFKSCCVWTRRILRQELPHYIWLHPNLGNLFTADIVPFSTGEEFDNTIKTLSKDFLNLNADQKAATNKVRAITSHLVLQLFIVINLTQWLGHDSIELQPHSRYVYVLIVTEWTLRCYVLRDVTHIFAIAFS